MIVRITLAVLLSASISSAEFTKDFSKWLENYYGPNIRDQMERRDLGPKGSFGGKANSLDRLIRQPVVFVHGVSDTAGDKMRQAADQYKARGYRDNELYSTTYFNGAQDNPIKWAEYSMKCEYVKQVRALIVAVRLYTGRAVDVIGFSLGVPVSRKAILGGYCVDTNEYLGGPLTKFIDTYVGVAGPNHGVAPQAAGISVPACVLSIIPVCNQVTGLYSGFCPRTSEYLQDINKQSNYEGKNVFTIYSKKDGMVGYKVCGQVTSQIAGQAGEKVYEELGHDQAFHDTHDVQVAMMNDHRVI